MLSYVCKSEGWLALQTSTNLSCPERKMKCFIAVESKFASACGVKLWDTISKTLKQSEDMYVSLKEELKMCIYLKIINIFLFLISLNFVL